MEAKNKVFKTILAANNKGIDGQMAAIQPDDETANQLLNYECAVGNSFRGRVGCQTAGSNGFFAIFPYRYTRTQDQYDISYQTLSGANYAGQVPPLTTVKTAADGASIEKLIALNRQVWMLDTMNVTITQDVAGVYTWYSTVDGANIDFNILKDGVSILSSAMGDGVTSSTSIYSLLGTIDGLAELSVSRTTRGSTITTPVGCPPLAIVDGAQTTTNVGSTSYGTIYRATVLAGHTFLVGDIISFTSNFILGGGFVIATTATTIDYVGGSATLTNTQVLGYMAQAATSFPISTISSETGGVLTISFPYWRLIPEGDYLFGFIFSSARLLWETKTEDSFYAPPVAVNDSGNLYIAASSQVSAGSSTWANNLIKMDGSQVFRAGLPTCIMTAGAPGAGALTGAYKWKAFLRRYDAQGNITDGPFTPNLFIPAGSSSGVGFTLAAQYMALTLGSNAAYSLTSGFGERGCFKHTTESPTSPSVAFYVDDATGGVGNTAFVQPGDVICLTDNTAQTTGLWTNAALNIPVGTLHRTRCTSYCPIDAVVSPTTSSIRVADSSGYQINADTHISTGLTIVVLRTTAGGNQYYKLCEIPANGFANPVIYDNVTDVVLATKEQYIEPEIGKEYNPPPPCTLVAQHQGGLVVARGPTSPNTVAFSTAASIEAFPTAANSFDVPSTQSGFITAIASDNDDRLAVFKERAYYDVVGDLDGGTFSINVRNEGDYGITSQASLVRIPFGLCGLSKNGFVVISDGLLDPFRFGEVNARLINQPYQYFWATAVNDYFNRNYLCVIPQITGEPVSYVIDYSRPMVRVFERSYTTQIDQAGGQAMVHDTMYHLSATSPYGVFRRLTRFDGNSPSGNGDGDSFIDNTNAINYVWESSVINLDTPGQLKSAIRGRLWSIPNDYVQEGWVPFSVLVETAASPFNTFVGSTNPLGTSTTITFSAPNFSDKDFKFVRQKTHFYIVRLTTNTIRTSPFITGYGILFADNYLNEDYIR